MKKLSTIILLSMTILGTSNASVVKNNSPFVYSVSAATQIFQGGRRDIHLGTHNYTRYVTATVNESTRVHKLDRYGREIWSGDITGRHTFTCGPDVYKMTFYLDDDKILTVTY